MCWVGRFACTLLLQLYDLCCPTSEVWLCEMCMLVAVVVVIVVVVGVVVTMWCALFVAEGWRQRAGLCTLYSHPAVTSDYWLIETSCTAQEARPAKVSLVFTHSPLLCKKWHLIYDDCLEDKSGDYQNCSVLFHRWQLLDKRCFQLTSRNFYSAIMIKLDCY